ncbi:MAG: LysM peptidoglycan-binding domain-containing protein [Kiritimatiellia bacterium]
MRRFILCFGVLAVLVFSGCSKFDLAEFEREQRSQVKFSQAVNAEKNGDLDEAIRLYKRVMIDEPKAYSAHFMLATLLHDHAEDYIGAIYHYRRYIELEPDSDKKELAEKRISIAEHLLAPEILKKVSDTHTGLAQATLLKDKARLNRVISRLEGEKVELNKQVQKQNAMLKDLSSENVQLRKIVEKMRGESYVETAEKPLKEKVAEYRESEKTEDSGFSKSELESLRREAESLKNAEKSEPVQKPVVDVPSVGSVLQKVQKRLTGGGAKESGRSSTDRKSDLDKEARETAADADLSRLSLFRTPEQNQEKDDGNKKQTYVVQPGDTLIRISTRFYGDGSEWKRIRNANRGQIGPAGRVRAGQIIIIP